LVVLEAAANRRPSPPELEKIHKVIDAIAEDGIVASYDPRRRAVQLAIEAERGQEALFAAMTRWREAARRVGLAAWQALRVDVIRSSGSERTPADY
jgi:hypothetical protein